MILRQYGKRMESVDPAFSAVALTSIGWRRNRELSMTVEEFEEKYREVVTHELTASAEGPVQIEVETSLLKQVEEQVRALEAGLPADQVLVVQSRRGVVEARAHEKKIDVIVDGENRLYFKWWMDPGLHMGVFALRD